MTCCLCSVLLSKEPLHLSESKVSGHSEEATAEWQVKAPAFRDGRDLVFNLLSPRSSRSPLVDKVLLWVKTAYLLVFNYLPGNIWIGTWFRHETSPQSILPLRMFKKTFLGSWEWGSEDGLTSFTVGKVNGLRDRTHTIQKPSGRKGTSFHTSVANHIMLKGLKHHSYQIPTVNSASCLYLNI